MNGLLKGDTALLLTTHIRGGADRANPLSRFAGEGRGPSRRDGKGEGLPDVGAVPHPPTALRPRVPPSPASGRGANLDW